MVEKKKDTKVEISHINEPGNVREITKKKDIEIKKKPVIEEIHKKPVLEVREKPIIKNITEPKEERFVREETKFEEYGNKAKGEKFINDQLEKNKKETIVKEKMPNIVEKDETPIVNKEEQIKKEIHHQPVIHEIHEKPITEIREKPIVKVIHENPEMIKVKESPIIINEDKNKSGTLSSKTAAATTLGKDKQFESLKEKQNKDVKREFINEFAEERYVGRKDRKDIPENVDVKISNKEQFKDKGNLGQGIPPAKESINESKKTQEIGSNQNSGGVFQSLKEKIKDTFHIK